ncbi:hypothetical protein NC796_16585 [Aliifodinibius sp. S!AR15-10]|uniref:glycoside hydrolase family 16 protein n=1 Tax=Aliifodinibius sp. S!AR15-10 TaxID=2950437 RepID=UPI0028625E15|nr:hypothetical protein [Aliifodinibius sp. S!AR15-10]MDR8392774.1 hypothetical protein [Aliifodinibius sp. S!AR15-10]
MNYTTSIVIIIVFTGITACSGNSQPTSTEEPDPPKDTTNTEGEVPQVETVEITNVTTTAAKGSGKVLADGSSSVIERGICWDTLQTPTMDTFHSDASSVKGSGEFSVNIEDLKDNTTYYARAYATNDAGVSYGEELEFVTEKVPDPVESIVFIDSTSFRDTTAFNEHWDLFYPWGDSHNGSALMVQEQMSLEPNGELLIEADPITHNEFNYASGAIHNRNHIVINDSLPKWEISGDFQVPTDQGTWPAFWITGAWNWPPEVDIMEFKGNNINWQNTATGPDWRDVSWQTKKTEISNADSWHNYKVIMKKRDDTYVDLNFYIDGKLTASHTADDFIGEPFWLIINMQMEGSSGSPGPDHAEFRARNIYLAATPAK